tara:strand:+ start:4514 stop:5686 length:1173 start_codon:yes stop_codon:yes gene_type:complete
MFRPKILCFISHYLPGYKSGGPLKSIYNLSEHLNDHFEFLIITSDRDFKDKKPYKSIKINRWNKVGKVKIFYASRSFMTIKNLSKLINNTNHNILYLNSFFNFYFTTLPLIVRKFLSNTEIPCVVAPRGEFSPEALKIKFLKKKTYKLISNFFGLYDQINWQASCKNEYREILLNQSIKNKYIKIAPDLPIKLRHLDKFTLRKYKKKRGFLKIVFLSRINPMKNLDYLIKVLKKIKKEVSLDIYGPVEDEKYWSNCLNLMTELPLNINVVYKGTAIPNKINIILSQYDLFILPSRGESYGHVVLESLIAGTPVVVSDKTPWKKKKDSITVLSLKSEKKWVNEIEKYVDFEGDKLLKRRVSAINFAKRYLSMKENINLNKNFFFTLYKQKP